MKLIQYDREKEEEFIDEVISQLDKLKRQILNREINFGEVEIKRGYKPSFECYDLKENIIIKINIAWRS